MRKPFRHPPRFPSNKTNFLVLQLAAIFALMSRHAILAWTTTTTTTTTTTSAITRLSSSSLSSLRRYPLKGNTVSLHHQIHSFHSKPRRFSRDIHATLYPKYVNGRTFKPLFVTTTTPSAAASYSNSSSDTMNVPVIAPTVESDDDDDEVIALEEVEASADETDDDDDDADIYLMDEDEIAKLPRGIPDDYAIIKQWTVPMEGLDLSPIYHQNGNDNDDDNDNDDRKLVVQRLQLTPTNVSLPVALTLILPDVYPSLSRARKICRKGNILLHRGPWQSSSPTSSTSTTTSTTTNGTLQIDRDKCKVGRVGDRVYPGDVIAKQLRLGKGHYHAMNFAKPPFDVPVLYEDDHFAAVNKPAGIVVYGLRKHGQGTMTIRSALPFCLTPPKTRTWAVLRRPITVHRLDKPTSGILLCAKTRPAMVELARQFSHRIVKKTYLAIVNGIPHEPIETSISSRRAFELGVDVDPNNDASSYWQLIDSPLGGKESITVWRALRYVKSLKANDGYLTLVELKPKTGRFHQLRRHMAWVCERPLVGDDDYDGGSEEARSFRDRGLFLCANRATLEHPFYNTESGRRVWDSRLNSEDDNAATTAKYANATIWLRDEDDKVMVTFAIDVPAKFQNFLDHEERRYYKLTGTTPETPVITESS